MDGWMGYQKCASIFFKLSRCIVHCSHNNIIILFKIWCKVQELGYDFQSYPMYVCFFISILKVRYFKHSCGNRHFFSSKFYIKLGIGEWFSIQKPRGPQGFLNLRGDTKLVLHVLCPSLSWPSAYLSLRGPAQHLHDEREARAYGWIDGMGWNGMDGWDGISKVSFNFLYTLWVYIHIYHVDSYLYTYIYIYILKNCHQHYGFENLIAIWGVGIWFSKLRYISVFFFQFSY